MTDRTVVRVPIHNSNEGGSLSSRDIGRRHLMGEVPLEEYFRSEDHIDEVFAAVRRRVVGVMLAARSPRGRCTGRDNYITGLDRRISSLSWYVRNNIRGLNRIFGHTHLPKHAVKLTRSEWDRVLERIYGEIIISILIVMRDDHSLWYQDGDWCFSNVIRVEHDRSVREVKQTWRNQRNFHGRPSKQGRRRAKQLRVAPGISIGGM